MDRFIVDKLKDAAKSKFLKSNMDRFIDITFIQSNNIVRLLKSNMDRFIVGKT